MQRRLGVMHVAVVQQFYGEADQELLARAWRPELAEAKPADGGQSEADEETAPLPADAEETARRVISGSQWMSVYLSSRDRGRERYMIGNIISLSLSL